MQHLVLLTSPEVTEIPEELRREVGDAFAESAHCQCDCTDGCMISCWNEITQEDLLCNPCRRFREQPKLAGHCHMFNPGGKTLE